MDELENMGADLNQFFFSPMFDLALISALLLFRNTNLKTPNRRELFV